MRVREAHELRLLLQWGIFSLTLLQVIDRAGLHDNSRPHHMKNNLLKSLDYSLWLPHLKPR